MKGPIARGTIRTSVVLGLRLSVQAGSLLLVARLLGPGAFGAFVGVAALAVIFGALAPFGTHLVLLAEVARGPERRHGVLSYAIPTTLLCGGFLLLVFLALSFGVLKGAIPFHIAVMVGFTEILLQPLFALMTSEHHALGRIAQSQLLQLLPMLMRLLVAAAVLVLDPPAALDAYVAGYLLASVFALSVGASTLPARWPSMWAWRIPTSKQLSHAWGYAAINITKTGSAELDKTLALKLLSPVSAGLYAAAARVVGAATLPVAAMTLSALPRLFRDGHALPGTRRLLGWMFGSAFGYGMVLAAALWAAAPLFDAVFGPQYPGIGEMIRCLCAAIPGMAMRLVLGGALMAVGRPWMRVTFELVGLVLLVALSLVLTSQVGAAGMPVALVVSEWVMAVLGSAFLVSVLRSPTTPR